MEVERLAVRISEFGEMLGVSRSKAYEVVAAHPELLIDVEGTNRVSVAKAREYVAKQSPRAAS
jgi:hypothetical protein